MPVNQALTDSPWLPFGVQNGAGLRLLCLPHAGAGASVYRAWGRGLPAEIAVCPVQPPGRERRYAETPLTSAREIAACLAPVIIESVRAPYALFGHSTGALVAFVLARQIRALGGPEPVLLFASGRGAPHVPLERTRLAGLSTAVLADVLGRLGGTPEEILRNEEMLAHLQPLLAADFTVNEGYVYEPEPPLAMPITVFAAMDDPRVGVPQAREWERQTSEEFRLHTLEGGHFAVFDHAADVHRLIARQVEGRTA